MFKINRFCCCSFSNTLSLSLSLFINSSHRLNGAERAHKLNMCTQSKRKVQCTYTTHEPNTHSLIRSLTQSFFHSLITPRVKVHHTNVCVMYCIYTQCIQYARFDDYLFQALKLFLLSLPLFVWVWLDYSNFLVFFPLFLSFVTHTRVSFQQWNQKKNRKKERKKTHTKTTTNVDWLVSTCVPVNWFW